jgi:hypothetical protein
MADTGRPSLYSDELGERICDRLASGESLRSICRAEGMPSERAVRRWALNDPAGFGARYAAARDEQAHALLDEIIDTARDEKDAQLGRMRVDALKWAASKILPKVYGDRQAIEHTGQTLEQLVLAAMAAHPSADEGCA